MTDWAYYRMFFCGIVSGQSLQAAFDVHRLQLAEALGLKATLSREDEKIFWQSTGTFLLKGSELVLPAEVYDTDAGQSEHVDELRRVQSERLNFEIQKIVRLMRFNNLKLSRKELSWVGKIRLVTANCLLFGRVLNALVVYALGVLIPYIKKDPDMWN